MACDCSPCRGPTLNKIFQLQHIVRRADQHPFPPHLPHAAQQELSEAAAVRDLAEHRLDDRFPPGIEMLAPLGPQGAPHPLRHRQGRRAPTARGGRPGASMTRAIRRDEGLTPQCGHRRHVRLAEIARVHARGPRHLARLGEHLGPQRLGLLLVIRLIGDLGGHDDLRRRIDGGLAVVPLDHAALRPGGRHDPALRIGKVALSRGRGDGVKGHPILPRYGHRKFPTPLGCC